jgi:hypothetical protein
MDNEKKAVTEAGESWARTELLLGLFNHIEQQIGLGETRAGLLLAAGAASAVAYMQVIKEMDLWAYLLPLGRGLLIVALLSIAVSILMALWAVRPALIVTLLGKRLHQASGRPSMVDFAGIAAQPRDTFVNVFQSRTERELQDDLLRSIHGKSCKARAKFTELLPASMFLGVSIATFGLAVLARHLPL